jgi:hypothetical protein
MKRFLLAFALLAPLASCSKKEAAPTPNVTTTNQAAMLVGTWEYKTARTQTTYDATPSRNTDVTNTITDRQMVFNNNGTYASIAQGNRIDGTYSLNATIISYGGATSTDEISELTSTKLVLVRKQTLSPGVNQVLTGTYAR